MLVNIRPATQDVRVSDSGFIEAARTPSSPLSSSLRDGSLEPQPRDRRPTVLFAVLAVVLAAFGVYAWGARAKADDVAAFDKMMESISVIDRNYLPVGSTEKPPCGARAEGWVERQFAGTRGPSLDELSGAMDGTGWAVDPGATAPGEASFSQTFEGRLAHATLRPGAAAGGLILTATIDANSLACRLP